MAEKKTKPTHEVTLRIKDRVWKATGTSILSALKKVKEPMDIKSFGTIETVVDGKLAYFPRRLTPTKIKRIFANEWELESLAKQIGILR